MQTELYRNTFRVRSIRLPDYDYTRNGYYFITICTYNKEEYFGNIKNEKMCLFRTGSIVWDCWQQIEILNHHIFIDDAFVVMPNHIHGIVIIDHGQADNFYSCVECNEWHNKKMNIYNNVKNNNKIRGRDVALQRLYDGDGKNDIMSTISPKRGSLSSIIRSYKSACTTQIRELFQDYGITSYFGWQERFYEHIIRNDYTFGSIQQYIYDNPIKWHKDRNSVW